VARKTHHDDPQLAAWRGVDGGLTGSTKWLVAEPSPYLMLYALAIGERVSVITGLDDALRILDRFDDVRGPGLLLVAITQILSGEDGRRYAPEATGIISVERAVVPSS
jgi:hypothetical protein